MTLRMGLAMIFVAGALTSCGGDSLGPAPGAVTARVTDSVGDTYGVDLHRWDVIAMAIVRDTGGITVQLDFSRTLISPLDGDSNAMIAFVEFDTDQDSFTGFRSTVDDFRPNFASTGIGGEFQLSLVTYAADSSVPVYNSFGGEVGRAKPVFRGKRVSIRIPRAILGGDDGFLNAAAIVGTLNSPSDIIPETGHLQLDAPGAASFTWMPRLVSPSPDFTPPRFPVRAPDQVGHWVPGIYH